MSKSQKIRCVVAGAGDHGREIIDLIDGQGLPEFADWSVTALTDSDPELKGQSVMNVPVVGDDGKFQTLFEQGISHGLVGIGLAQGTERRARVFAKLGESGFKLPVLVHPGAVIASNVELGAGSVVLAGALVGTGCRIGKNVVINLGAAVSHDCVIGDHCIVADGAHVTGGVKIEEAVLVGAGATVLPYITIGKGATVGAGAVVTKNVSPGMTVVGVPAQPIKRPVTKG
ncbi:MAG: acetyltransferase [SAR202 cluster bacterium]|nr:acetyltransferase [SAR202 cluster bacterium]|tara:strand:- start:1936 stop:2622 length:687 start_codon:yes stop_codon:yes gene_type:complete